MKLAATDIAPDMLLSPREAEQLRLVQRELARVRASVATARPSERHRAVSRIRLRLGEA
jgi:hypothetical protein